MRPNAEAFLGMPASLDTPCGLLGMLAYAAEWVLGVLAYAAEQLLGTLAHAAE
jgi:hypothetical protein